MNGLMTVGDVQTMSSREIAELTRKNHADVCRDVRVMLAGLYGGQASEYVRKANLLHITNQGVNCERYDNQNPNAWEYLLDRRHTEILVTGYDVKRTIETLADNGVIVRPQIEDEQKTDSLGRLRSGKR